MWDEQDWAMIATILLILGLLFTPAKSQSVHEPLVQTIALGHCDAIWDIVDHDRDSVTVKCDDTESPDNH